MSLGIESLEAHGISRRVISLWKRDGVNALLPLQEEAVARTGVLQNKSLIVFAPTSSGKTFIAEIAALKHLESSRAVIYLVPTKALAEEKFRRFNRLYGPLGYRILAATRERPETDAPVLLGRFDLLVAVYEKMKSYLVQKPSLLSRAGLVIADEIQMLGEAERGGVADILITKIVQSPYKTQFLGLSAVLGDALRIARWLDCDFLKESRRPIELREGVFNASDGKFYYRSFNTKEEGVETLAPEALNLHEEQEDFYERAVLELARILAKIRDEQVMIFVPTRGLSRIWAEKLANSLELEPVQSAIEVLEKYEETRGRDVLLSCFRSGVAFHNADLSWSLRRLIEDHYMNGNLKVLICTSTLGEGVNLTGKNVIQIPEMVREDEWTGEYHFVPLSRSRFRNQGGRAGRLGLETGFGRSILLASGEEQTQRLRREYLYGELEPLKPPLN
ncbi:DEAD/DEAH box helicase, partial [Candidatus Sumerlaeota bacterium]|nr:DEAD/DEAH box helicase [Candidatus Sumerlaeota bacterium]